MARGSGDHALVRRQHPVDDRGVGLGAAHEEKDVGIRAFTGVPDLFFCFCAVVVRSVAGQLFPVRLYKPRQDLFMRAFCIVVFK